MITRNVFGLIDLITGNGSTSGEFENIEGLGLSGMRIENFDFRPRVFAQDKAVNDNLPLQVAA
ncbi:MAG: hypothetical protein AAGF28_10220 [Pseudomonadota bacterium]